MSKLDDIFTGLSYGYTYLVSDYATSREEELEYEAAGKADIAKAKQQIKDLVVELIQQEEELTDLCSSGVIHIDPNELRKKVEEL